MLFLRIDTLETEPTTLNVSEKPSPEGDWALCSDNLERDIRQRKPIKQGDFVILKNSKVDVFPIRALRTKDVREIKKE